MIGSPQQIYNGTNNVNNHNVILNNVKYNQNTINTMTTDNTQQMNKQATTKNRFTNATSVVQKSLISINKFRTNFLFSLNQEQGPSLYS